MSKSADAFRTISEVADWLSVPTHVLRFWESKFSQIKPVKRAGGRRYYRPKDMLIIGGIKKLLHDDGITIKGAQKIIREQGIAYLVTLSQPLDDDISESEAAETSSDAQLKPATKTSPDTELHDVEATQTPQERFEEQESDQFDLFAPKPGAANAQEPSLSQPAQNLWAPVETPPAPQIAPQFDDIMRALNSASSLSSAQLNALHPLLDQIKSAWDRRVG